ncbi:MAG: late competence development ComFB family protein [Rubrivivax sp.]
MDLPAVDFSSVVNRQENAVFRRVMEVAAQRRTLSDPASQLLDVACLALNRLPPRYIRHEVDFYFYLSPQERNQLEDAIVEAVDQAFAVVEQQQQQQQPPQREQPPQA